VSGRANAVMKGRALILAGVAAATVVAVARGGHELPVYPSYYPHEIRIESVSPDRAAELLRAGKIQAHVSSGARPVGDLPDSIVAVESLGAYVVVQVNPASPLANDEAAACALGEAVVRDLSGRGGDFIFHPYPVTPFHGDYLHHVDLAEAVRTRLQGTPSPVRDLKLKALDARGAGLVRQEWRADGPEWDVAIETIDAGALVASATLAMNGWLGPHWVRNGWFQAYRVLAEPGGQSERDRNADAAFVRLQAGDFGGAAEKINLERDLVRSLVGGCRRMVAGYMARREPINAEFSAGIENIAFDAIEGLSSPLFIRTVKLKDFPWNGWLALGMNARPAAAWNPVAGFTDEFGRLMWFALGDPALVPSPYESAWMLNRVSDVQPNPSR
jgi:hypothetical protein